MNEKTIALFGTGRAKQGDSAYNLAYETGRLLAQAGFTIINGGYGGTMEAAAKGAAEVRHEFRRESGDFAPNRRTGDIVPNRRTGGEIIGVTCSAFKSSKANKYVSRTIVTGSLDERLDTLIKLGQAYVVLPGGTGTLLELAKVWELKNKGFLETGKPIILVGSFWKPLVDLVAIDDPDSSRYIKLADSPEEVVGLIIEDQR
ncbi:MAG: hypothetical protein A2167_02270 [Planctomycetes bacterium RBG_13_46_10]|nr:MAG: hypothetical protein A2167_02270 [Planctomycetes bacterium RBG_13_46_10]